MPHFTPHTAAGLHKTRFLSVASASLWFSSSFTVYLHWIKAHTGCFLMLLLQSRPMISLRFATVIAILLVPVHLRKQVTALWHEWRLLRRKHYCRIRNCQFLQLLFFSESHSYWQDFWYEKSSSFLERTQPSLSALCANIQRCVHERPCSF